VSHAVTADSLACVRTESNRGLLMALAPASLLWSPLSPMSFVDDDTRVVAVARVIVAVVVFVCGLRLRRDGGPERRLAALSVLFTFGHFVATHLDRPGQGFVAMVALVAIFTRLWPSTALRDRDAGSGSSTFGGGATVVAAAVVAVVVLVREAFEASLSPAAALPLVLQQLLPMGLLASTPFFADEPPWRRRGVLALLTFAAATPLFAAVSSASGLAGGTALLLAGAIGPLGLVTLVLARRRHEATFAQGDASVFDVVLRHPPRVLVVSFVGLSVLCASLLALPIASVDGVGLGALDAAFTGVSATCVTGLTVKDTAVDFSFFGQLVILVFLQVGGIGIMVVSAAAVVVLGRRMSLQHEAAAVDLVGADGRAGLMSALRTILGVTFACEFATATALSILFIADGDDIVTGLWRGAFTAVSAFCNAGFALQSSSLIPYQTQPLVLTVVAAAVTVGGAGPLVVVAVIERARLSLQARLVVVTSAVLVVLPALLILVFEWNASLGELPVLHKVTNAIFQSVTLRSAGFNSVDLTSIQRATWTVMLVVMFIGGSPGSTAGGMKTTTVAVIALAVASTLRGHSKVTFGNRTVAPSTVLRATSVVTVGFLFCFLAVLALQLTQDIPDDDLIFEVVSAMATGLTMGATGALDEVGKVIIIVVMFAGRIGPLTFFVFLASRAPAASRTQRVEESVAVG